MTPEAIQEKTLPILRSYGVLRAGLFGSAARGDMTADSDVDILIDLKKETSLLEFVAIKQSLEEALGKNVDLVEYAAIKPRLRENILSHHIALL